MFHVKHTKRNKKTKEKEEKKREEKSGGLSKEVCSYATQNPSKYWYNWITAIL